MKKVFIFLKEIQMGHSVDLFNRREIDNVPSV